MIAIRSLTKTPFFLSRYDAVSVYSMPKYYPTYNKEVS